MNETEKWIRPGQGKVIALLHGIGAKDAQGYWKPFLDVLLTDETLQSFGLFVWKYPTHLEPGLLKNVLDSVKGTTLRESAPRIKLLGEVWNTTYQTQFRGFQDIVLICHSMGGLVAKSWIIDALEQGQSTSLDTLRHLAFYATPHEGAPITTLATWNQQLRDMQLDSALIEDVGRRWYDHVVAWKEKTPDASTHLYNRYIPHLVIAGINDDVVPPKFASIRGMQTTLVVGDHSQVIQPLDTSDTRYKAWRDDLEQTLQARQPAAPLSASPKPHAQELFQSAPTGESSTQKALTIFFSYAPEDERLAQELEKQLTILKRQNRIIGWLSRDISAGEETDEEIVDHLNQARIILLLISPDFLSSERLWGREVELALQKHEAKEARVIPILLRPTDDWEEAPFGKLQALPKNKKAVTSWSNRDEAFAEVARGIREAVVKLTSPNP